MWGDSSLFSDSEKGGGGGDGGGGGGGGCFGFRQSPLLINTPLMSSPLIMPAGFSPTVLLDYPLLFIDPQVSSSNQHLGYDAGSQEWQSMLQMPLELDLVSLPEQENKICASELLMDIETFENSTMELKCKADRMHHSTESQTHHSREAQDSTQLQQLPEGDRAGVFPSMCIGSPSDDGYNWRKYGQKQVKGSECPRSYYKCTHPTCQVKKKIERALDGQITEIIYMGSHNHPKPHSTRPALGSSYKLNDMASDPAIGPGEDLKTNSEDMTSSASVVTKVSQDEGDSSSLLEDDSKFSSLASENDEDGVTERTMLPGNVNESELKKRKKEIPSSHGLRQQKVVLRTVSEVDILEDGYRWRKYGQKIVKGNPNPRSYYKCTTPGCSVRKHIERAADDIRSVITSYEGKHNHEVPGARNSNNIYCGRNTRYPELNTLTSFMASGSAGTKPEPQALVPYAGNNFEICNEYLKTSSLGGVIDAETMVLSSCPMMSQPPPAPPFLAFGMNNHREAQQVIPMASFDQELPVSYPMEFGHSNYAWDGYDLSCLKSISPGFCSSAGHGPEMNSMMTFKNPKQEVHRYGSPDSALSYAQFSPPLSSTSDGQPLPNSEQTTTGGVLK